MTDGMTFDITAKQWRLIIRTLEFGADIAADRATRPDDAENAIAMHAQLTEIIAILRAAELGADRGTMQ